MTPPQGIAGRSLAAALIVAVAIAAPWHHAPAAAGAGSPSDSTAHNLVAVEFRESPASDLSVSGGLLGVPDSAGAFPPSFRRFDPASGHGASPGSGAGNLLVFTDLRPGTYRVALVLLEQSALMRRLLREKDRSATEDRCLVYGDSAAALTFTVGNREFRYLGRITRKTQPSIGANEMWRTTTEWSPGDEVRAVKILLKRKDYAAWRDLLAPRAAPGNRGSTPRPEKH